MAVTLRTFPVMRPIPKIDPFETFNVTSLVPPGTE